MELRKTVLLQDVYSKSTWPITPPETPDCLPSSSFQELSPAGRPSDKTCRRNRESELSSKVILLLYRQNLST